MHATIMHTWALHIHAPRSLLPPRRLANTRTFPTQSARRRSNLACRCDGSLPTQSPPPSLPADLPLGFFPDRRLVEDIQLPSLLECQHFVNLTNGIEAIPQLQRLGLPFSFVRIQSTACEQQQFEKILQELDSTLLLHLALGHCCLVYDCGSRNKKRGAPRALWYGIEWIRYALTSMWLPGVRADAYLRGYSVASTFEGHFRGFSKSTKRRLQYFAKYLPPGGLPEIRLYGVYRATDNDDDFEHFRSIMHQALLPAELASCGAAAVAGGQQPAVRGWQLGAAAVAQQQGAGGDTAADSNIEALLRGDPHQAVEGLLGMRLFLGGISHADHRAWRRSFDEAGGSSSGGDC